MLNNIVSGYRSFRLSIRWLPEDPSEPTSTIVLTGARTGIFVDTRFLRNSGDLDWAIAGYRTTDSSLVNRDLETSVEEVEEKGTNSILPDGTTLEVGEMINPETGKMTPFEEIWRDEEEMDASSVLFIKNTLGTTWQGRVGNAQMGLGRGRDGAFWAWQAEKEANSKWVVRYATRNTDKERITYLPDYQETVEWKEGTSVKWAGDMWVLLERGRT
ncbi:hypothetical protein H0H87_011457 [Tephrocybe sp. NHM501043]|nr:hypothetical protein H0H87_011457 [Tephrocybe sp. NHM501043]